MIIIYGQRNCGKVDKVPNLFYVVTQFAHLYWFPLIPLRSYLVLAGSEDGESFKGVQTSMSFKSIVIGWLRAVLFVSAIGSLVASIIITMQYVDGNRKKYDLTTVLVPWLLLFGALIVYWLTLKFTFASLDRALHPGEQLGLSPLLVEKFLDQRFQEELEDNDRQEETEPEKALRKSPQDA
jgi:hypothetical protein